jgi:hypothetical protein
MAAVWSGDGVHRAEDVCCLLVINRDGVGWNGGPQADICPTRFARWHRVGFRHFYLDDYLMLLVAVNGPIPPCTFPKRKEC